MAVAAWCHGFLFEGKIFQDSILDQHGKCSQVVTFDVGVGD